MRYIKLSGVHTHTALYSGTLKHPLHATLCSVNNTKLLALLTDSTRIQNVTKCWL